MMQKKIHGFTIKKEKEVSELNAVLYHMIHDQTGLELVWLKRNEENKTFGIAFETLPWDDTGVFHILEHSVLCGSKRYPVKEPFVELMKGSLNTFLNAMTFPDKTFYPVSSRNDKDFINLVRVYLDAVFCPLIYTKPEIFQQEGWHYELDETGSVSYKGVVFNEMKGAFADASRIAMTALNQLLFPDSTYKFEYGGDPAVIPDLTYEAFLDSHRRFYAPSNAYIFLDGDMDIESVLAIIHDEYLCKYERTQRMAPPAIQSAVSGTSEREYELSANEALEGKNRLSFGKVIGTFAEREKLIAMQILAEVICGTNQSPLSKAILSAGLAEEVRMTVNDGVLQPWVLLDIKNVKDEDLTVVESTLKNRLEALAESGLDHIQLEAVMANFEFKLREQNFGYYPQGLVLGFHVLQSWLYGGDPSANLEIGDLFVNLKRKMHEGYFEQLIRDVLLENLHSARVILHPSHTVGEKRREAEKERLEREKAAWNEEKRSQIVDQQKKLLAWQNSVDTPEVLAMLPQLKLEDIPKQPEQIPTVEKTDTEIPIIIHPLNTGGIVYISLYFDASSCNEEALSQLSFLCRLLCETGTSKHSAEEIINRTRLLCGDLNFAPVVYTTTKKRDEQGEVITKLCVSFSVLEANLSEALELICEILTEGRFVDEVSHDQLRQTKMGMFQRIMMSGNAIGVGRLFAQTSSAGVAEEAIHGISYYQWLKQQDENWEFEELKEKMTDLLARLINKKSLTISVTGAEENAIQQVTEMIATKIPAKDVLPKAEMKPWGKRKEGILIPSDVSFAVMGGNVLDNGGEFCGQLQLASQIIHLGYLWNCIRVQGGAYGTGMVARDTGLTACYSYRDPNGVRSVESYRGAAEFLRTIAYQCDNFTGFIIGTVANSSPLMTSKMKAQIGDKFYFSHITWEERCRVREQLLGTTADDLIAIANILAKTINEGGICLVGNQKQLEGCTELEHMITL